VLGERLERESTTIEPLFLVKKEGGRKERIGSGFGLCARGWIGGGRPTKGHFLINPQKKEGKREKKRYTSRRFFWLAGGGEKGERVRALPGGKKKKRGGNQ